ncbi:iron uptake porin [Calothrix sp. PCC 6303]|uniref:iron uptake porin n=1 Tax=Calothrix sp. PCC 6303 TaxID=1170562 RepID=UPI0002A03EE3|nr:iron uptake porin [Calothrix sp. PCC 6303]AFY99753.1 Carbohydrate-selective porin OprB [Calothrix sp. PCC 6303]
MELSIKDFLKAGLQIQTRCKTPSPQLLFGSIVGCSAFSQLCLPSLAELANIIPASDSEKGVETQIQGQQDVTSCHTSISCPTVDVESVEFSSIPDNGENTNFNALDKIPTVDELTDVKPTDWAYQALKTLMERYGILSAYPDSKFRGNQQMTRYEFAAGLAITIDKVEDLVANAIGDEYIRQDAITLRRLQKEYRVVLDELQRRIDQTELKAATIQAQRFSTTTKLQGQQIVGVSGGSSAANTLVSRTRLNLLTSFQPQDLLVTQLESGNNGGDAVAQEQREGLNYLGTAGLLANAGGLQYSDVDSQLRLRRLSYSFRPQKDLEVTIGAKISPRDFIDKNSYANNEAADFSSGALLNNPLIVQNQIDREGGAGGVVVWNPSPKLIMRSLYVAKNGNQPNQGISGDGHQATVEVEYNPSQKLRLKLQYTNAQVNDTDINAVGLNTEYSLNKETGIFGRFGIGSYQGFNTAINRDFDATPISWSVGVTRRNVVIPGTLAGVAVGQPFITGDLGNSTQTNFEAFYNLQLNDNISVTPVFSLVTNPDNDKSNGTIWQSSLRTVFSF